MVLLLFTATVLQKVDAMTTQTFLQQLEKKFPGEILGIGISEPTSTILVLLETEVYFAKITPNGIELIGGPLAIPLPPLVGRMLRFALCHPTLGHAYIIAADNSITTIDIEKQSIILIANLGLRIVQAAISPDGSKIYLTGDDVTVFSTTRQHIVGPSIVSSPFGYAGIACSPDGRRVYACGMGNIQSPGSGGHLAIIDAQTDTVLKKITEIAPDDLAAVSYDSCKAYFGNPAGSPREDDAVYVVDAASEKVLPPTIYLDTGMTAMKASKKTPKIYVVTEDHLPKLLLIDSNKDEIVSTTPMKPGFIGELEIDAHDNVYLAQNDTLIVRLAMPL